MSTAGTTADAGSNGTAGDPAAHASTTETPAWAAFVEATRVMCELAGIGLCIVHLDEMPPRAWVVAATSVASAEHARDDGTLSSPTADIIRATLADTTDSALAWRAVRWSDRRALFIANIRAAATVTLWAQREVDRFRDFARADAALDALGEGVVVVDGDQRIAYCTRRAAELLGVADATSAEGRPVRELLPHAVSHLEPNEVARGTNGPDQKITWIAHHLAPAIGRTARRAGLVMRLRSDARFLETRRGQMQLLSALRHDVRSPLTALRGLVSVIQEEPDMPRDERQSLLELLRQEAERTVTWVEDYLIILRLRFEPRPLSPVAMTPDRPLRALEAQIAPHAKDRGVTFSVDILTAPTLGDGPPPMLDCDPGLIDAFCKNLVGHFMRLADRGATVNIRIEADGTLVVEGFGPGLFAHHPANPFTTLARSTASGKRTPGVGLGLFLAKKIADVHGWPIAITSHEGRVRAVVRWTGDRGASNPNAYALESV